MAPTGNQSELHDHPGPPDKAPSRPGFGEDFRRFFLRGLGTLLPTVITFWLLFYAINFLWESIGWYLIQAIKQAWSFAAAQAWVEPTNWTYINWFWDENRPFVKVTGVLLALLTIYLVGLLVGNVIGRFFYGIGERLVLRLPIVRAVYPAVKQITDLLLSDRESQFSGSRVVAVQPHASNIWSVGLVTGEGLPPLSRATAEQMVTVFIPSSPTAFSGYVVMAPRRSVVELPMGVEEAMRLLVTGGVVAPKTESGAKAGSTGSSQPVVLEPSPTEPAVLKPLREPAEASAGE